MAMKKFRTKRTCKNWLKKQKSAQKWIAKIKDGYLGITIGGKDE